MAKSSITSRAYTKGPSPNLYWTELACHDGTQYPEKWRVGRLPVLAVTFEDIRRLLGSVPIIVLSGYRSPEYNATLEGAASNSQHIHGRALDLFHTTLPPERVFHFIRKAHAEGELPMLGGIGLYRTFVHIDTRPTTGRLAIWYGKGVKPS